MSLLVVEKSTGAIVASNNVNDRALSMARNRGVASEDMMFVVGDPAIRVFRVAHIIVSKLHWLPDYLFKQGKSMETVKRAEGWLNLWQEVMTSRLVDDPERSPLSLPVLFGNQLAAEIMVAIDAFEHPNCEVFVPATLKTREEAIQEGYRKARSTRRHLFVLARHELLGLYLVAPSTSVSNHPGFKIERVFVRRPE